jgi:CheY-like chemotaxis protein
MGFRNKDQVLTQKIYVVDDDPGLRTAYAASIHKLGYDVEIAADGLEALNLVKKAKPALVVLDLLMPNLDGLGFLRKLRENSENKDIQIVVVSNFEQMPEAENLGVARHLSKVQHGPDEIAAVVQQLLKNS